MQCSGVRWIMGEQIDRSRRGLGEALDAVGLGRIETTARVVHRAPVVTLKAYGRTPTAAPPLVLVPAPIKRAYIWDLLPEGSVVRLCLRRGVPVYLLEWLDPGPAEDGFGLGRLCKRRTFGACDTVSG